MKSVLFARRYQRILFLAAGVFGLLLLFSSGLNNLPTQDFTLSEKTTTFIQAAVQKQQKTEKEIKAYEQSGKYTFDQPLIIQNPYGSSPLTALVIFDTPDSLQISIHIPGKTSQASVDFTFDGFNKHHEIPVYGLYADSDNRVTLVGKDQAGKTAQTVLEMKTEPLPVHMDSVKIIQANQDNYSPGVNFTFRDYKIVFDVNGDIRWYSTDISFETFMRLRNGRYLFTYVMPDGPNYVMMEQDLLGKIYSIYNIPDGARHDLAELPDGNILVTSQDHTSQTIMDYLIELDRKNGHIVRSFDLKKYLDPSRPNEIDSSPQDWFHFNSIVYDANDHSVIISGRGQSAVVKFSYPDMQIQWILGPHDNWTSRFQSYLLAPVGDPFDWAWSQHHATLLSETSLNGSQIIDILLFDNGNYRSFEKKTALSPANSYSRIVHFQINETDHTVKQVWEYGKERGAELFSVSRGSAYLLPNGDFLGNWGEIVKDQNGQAALVQSDAGRVYSEIIEINPQDNQVVFEAEMNSVENYRTFRAGFYENYAEKTPVLSVTMNDTTTYGLGKQVITGLQGVKKVLDRIQIWMKASVKDVLKQAGFARQ
jgi:arylsulfate sulfotransferase